MTTLLQYLLIVIILLQQVCSIEKSQPSIGVELTLEKSEPPAITDYNYIQIEQWRSYQLNTRILENKDGCPNNCNNHGICDNSNKTCMCNTNWTGVDCLTYVPPITEPIKPPVPVKTACEECCSNACNTHMGMYNINSCNCNKCFPGSYCCVKDNNCLHGSCVNNSCVCDSGYYRFSCSERCPQPCHNGRCSDDKCICKTGWSGTDCSTPVCSNDCSGNGSCYNGICSCNVGWRGIDCSDVQCPNNCSGLGTCINNSCKCLEGFSGIICENTGQQSNCRGVWTNHSCHCSEGQIPPYCVSCQTCMKNCPEECKHDEENYSDPALVGIIFGSIMGPILLIIMYLSCSCPKCLRKNSQDVGDDIHDEQPEQQAIQNIQNRQSIPNNNNTVVLLDQIVSATQNIQHTNHDNNISSTQQVIQVRQNKAHVQQNNNVVSKQQVSQDRSKQNNNIVLSKQISQQKLQTQKQIQNYHSILQFKQNHKKYQMADESIIKKKSQCSICLDDIDANAEYKINCPSKHIFHKKCIDQWLLKHQTCPQCRGQINSE